MAGVFSDRDEERLAGVHPTLIEKIRTVFTQMATIGHPMFVVVGVRTVLEQQVLYAQGRRTPGPIVTMKDGYIHRSDHQTHLDGKGHAVDCAFLNVPDPFAIALPWEAYGVRVEQQGLTWGGRWSHPHDSPHAELP